MASRNLELARKAYSQGDIEQMKTAHKSNQNNLEEQHRMGGQFIKSAVYSGLTGILIMFGIASGAFGSNLSNTVVLILGISSLIADGISMGVADYMGTKSKIEFTKAKKKHEEWEVNNKPEHEKTQMKRINTEKGLNESDATVAVDTLAKYPKAWVDIIMIEEIGLFDSNQSPLKNGLVSFFSFILLGLIPLLPYIAGARIINASGLFGTSLGLSVVTLFLLGFVKTRFTGKNAVISGLETLFVGACVASAAFLIGWALEPLAH